jgi:hypothetical protein
MSGDKQRSRLWRPPYLPSCAPASPPASCGARSRADSTSTNVSSRPAGASREKGFLLILLLPCLALLTLFFAGSLEVAARSQARIALQSRLDTCAVRAAVARERLLRDLRASNAALESTILGIYAARAALLAPGAGAGAAAEAGALLRANGALAAAQDADVGKSAAEELAPCGPDSFSSEYAACLATPPVAASFRRQPALFPDVRGLLAPRDAGGSSRVRCVGGRGLVTELVVRGSPLPGGEAIRDFYAR